jgi:hypothetical protein
MAVAASVDAAIDQVCPVVEDHLYVDLAIAVSIVKIDGHGPAGEQKLQAQQILLLIGGAVVRKVNFDDRFTGIVGEDEMPLAAMGGSAGHALKQQQQQGHTMVFETLSILVSRDCPADRQNFVSPAKLRAAEPARCELGHSMMSFFQDILS